MPQAWHRTSKCLVTLALAACIFGAALLLSEAGTAALLPALGAPEDGWLAYRLANLCLILLFCAALAVLTTGVARWRMSAPRISEELGLGLGRIRGRTLALAAIGTPFLSYLGTLLLPAFSDPGPHLLDFDALFSRNEGGILLQVALVLAVSLGPALGEEFLFRGFLFRRLSRCMHVPTAFLLTSILFSAVHNDLQHSAVVLPVSLWLTYLAWQAQATAPAIVAHFVNNLVATCMVTWTSVRIDHFPPWLHALALGVSLPSFLASIALVRRQRVPPPRRA